MYLNARVIFNVAMNIYQQQHSVCADRLNAIAVINVREKLNNENKFFVEKPLKH